MCIYFIEDLWTGIVDKIREEFLKALLKLVHKMCKYEMHLTSTVGDTEQARWQTGWKH